ncbi:hypothetical protein GCM10007907_34610 [Chitinimonas prasina]|uniref:Uncharacterized protein n=1 Tax=Chitinimonas prasina TaxID=1434937 RepID=A0ABQ5YMY8_9NEIS|nr:hypothetical protein [Chitinimonas prasina]GLR14671.1 hypothetical protein GCM10007907_34610 [Chitinimonas prasina]
MRLILTILLLVALPTVASPTIQPGEYLTEGGWGTLKIKPGKNKQLTFVLDAIGANAHSCNLEGEIINGRATLEAEEEGKACVVGFKPKGDDLEVADRSEGYCRYYCGMRASFEGLYIMPAPGCTLAGVRKARKAFKQAYDKKAYADAEAHLSPLLNNCNKTLNWLEEGWIRNDLALAQYKSRNLLACRETLQALADDAAKTDAELREDYPPTDAESYLPIMRATRTNLKLCKGSQ